MRYHLWIKLLVVFSVSCGGTHNLLLEKRARSEVQNIKIESASRNKKTGDIDYTSTRVFLDKLPLELKKINSVAIEEAKNRNYNEAVFLFSEVSKYIKNGVAENNLAVTFEAMGKYEEAFIMYTKALDLSQQNSNIEKNFLIFLTEEKGDYKKSTKNRWQDADR